MPIDCSKERHQISKGFLEEAKSIAENNIRRFGAFAEMDIPIVGLEPSEILTLRDEYVDLCDDESVQLAEKIAAKSFLFEEFLYTELAARSEERRVGEGCRCRWGRAASERRNG